ncbi:hypothetical protein F4604DRAFT_1674609 [Suillus subluteus]|nr:hypothetical protein F4604DRAFT_1674609 [Suillus subluteus]
MPAQRAQWLQTQTESQTYTDVEGDSMLETEDGLGHQAFIKAERKRAKPAGETGEKNWEHLFQAIYYHMHKLLKKQIQECSADGLQHLHKLPFTEMADLQYWSSEFAANPVPDHPTDSQKPGLVLLDYRLRKVTSSEKSWKDVLIGVKITKSDLSANHKIPLFLEVSTKGYLMIQEQPWRHFILLFSISNFKLCAHYMDRSGMVISKPLQIVESPGSAGVWVTPAGKCIKKMTEKATQAVVESTTKLKRKASGSTIKNPFKKKPKNPVNSDSPTPTSSPAASVIDTQVPNTQVPLATHSSPSPTSSLRASIIEVSDSNGQ